MTEKLPFLLRVAGAGLLLLAMLHVPLARHLKWRDEAGRMSEANAAIFQVHAFFICLLLVMMGLPCVLDPAVWIEKSRAAAWACWSMCGFWTIRLYCQWFVYGSHLWRGKRVETGLHIWFTLVWIFLAGLFAACGAVQLGWLA